MTIVFRPKRECEYDKQIGSLQLRYSRPICNLCQVLVLLPLFLQPACNVQGAEIQKKLREIEVLLNRSIY